VTVVVNTRDDFSLENFRRVAFEGESVEIGPGASQRMQEGRAGFMRLLDSDRTQFIYGVTSNFGPRAKVTIPPEEQGAHAVDHGGRGAWGRGFGGGYLDERVVRGIIFARLTNFVAGNSKARPVVAERLAALLDGPMPKVPLDGEVGAGEVLPMAHVLKGFDRADLEEGEGNPLSNGSPCSAALAADVALQAGHRLGHAEQVLALSVEAIRAPLDPFDELFETLFADDDDAAAIRSLRGHLAGASPDGRRYDLPRSYRVLGRVLAQVRRAVAAVEEAARVSLRSVTDNPVYVPPDDHHRLGRAFSTGGYHNAMAYPALNGLTGAWADLSLLIERHVTALGNPAVSGLPPGATIGFGRVVSGFVEEARAVGAPTLLPAAVNDAQDDVSSPVFSAYRRQNRAAECIDNLLAMLAAESSQALFSTRRRPAPGLEVVLEELRAIFPPLEGASARRLGEEVAGVAAALAGSALSGSTPFSCGP
jgi:histidine ammonia-lyase